MTVLILLGPPGAGKGTQAKMIGQRFGLRHLSTGDILRRAISRGDPIGQEAQSFIDQGNLIPNDLMVSLIAQSIDEEDAALGCILDGFPRTIEQAKALDALFEIKHIWLDAVIEIRVPDVDVLVKRITGRLVCQSCGANYHVTSNPPSQPDQCDICKQKGLERRSDDYEATLRARFRIYHESTSPLLPYYQEKNKLYQVDGTLSISDQQQMLVDIIKKISSLTTYA